MVRNPFDYLSIPFNSDNFPDLFMPIWVAALVMLVLTIVLYNVRSHQLRRHEGLRTMQEWIFWTGFTTFSMILVEAIFSFYFMTVILTLVLGIGTLVWIRFSRFPPYIAAYNAQLARARSMSEARQERHPARGGSTIRPRHERRRRRR